MVRQIVALNQWHSKLSDAMQCYNDGMYRQCVREISKHVVKYARNVHILHFGNKSQMQIFNTHSRVLRGYIFEFSASQEIFQ